MTQIKNNTAVNTICQSKNMCFCSVLKISHSGHKSQFRRECIPQSRSHVEEALYHKLVSWAFELFFMRVCPEDLKIWIDS